jgi:hypothetical protein
MKLILICCIVLLSLIGCVSTPEKIQATPTGGSGSLPIPVTNPTIVTDLQSASYNLDQAVAIGALSPDDPAPGCLHDFLQKAGIENPSGAVPASFAPRNDGIASAGSIVYIQIQQAKAISGQGGVSVAVSCKALLGQFVIDGATATVKGAARLLPLPLR